MGGQLAHEIRREPSVTFSSLSPEIENRGSGQSFSMEVTERRRLLMSYPSQWMLETCPSRDFSEQMQ